MRAKHGPPGLSFAFTPFSCNRCIRFTASGPVQYANALKTSAIYTFCPEKHKVMREPSRNSQSRNDVK